MLSGRVFHICGPKVVRLLVPYLVVLCLLTIRLFGRTLGLTLEVKISFIKEGFKLLIVLNISVAKILVFFTFIVEVLPFSNQSIYSDRVLSSSSVSELTQFYGRICMNRNTKQGDNSWNLHKLNCFWRPSFLLVTWKLYYRG